eukprot:6209396-Pleurochrysis_carterae.AAC.5
MLTYGISLDSARARGLATINFNFYHNIIMCIGFNFQAGCPLVMSTVLVFVGGHVRARRGAYHAMDTDS